MMSTSGSEKSLSYQCSHLSTGPQALRGVSE